MKTEILLIGAGGHCPSCIDVIEQEGRFSIAGVVDKVRGAESLKLKAESDLRKCGKQEDIDGKRDAESGKIEEGRGNPERKVLGYPFIGTDGQSVGTA